MRAMGALCHHGMIAHVFNRDLAESLIATRKPVVNVSGVLPDLPLPRVGVDHVAVGRLAACHLLDRGFRHFGFVGYPDHAFSVGRETGFRTTVEEQAAGSTPIISAIPSIETPPVSGSGTIISCAGWLAYPSRLAFSPATTSRGSNSRRRAARQA